MDLWTISKEFHFSASHQLWGLPEEHQCARLHGHNYILVVKLFSSKLMPPGFVLDYGELGFVKELVDTLDHRHLNDIYEFNPTSENVTKYIYGYIKSGLKTVLDGRLDTDDVQVAVGLSETPKTWAWYTEE